MHIIATSLIIVKYLKNEKIPQNAKMAQTIFQGITHNIRHPKFFFHPITEYVNENGLRQL